MSSINSIFQIHIGTWNCWHIGTSIKVTELANFKVTPGIFEDWYGIWGFTPPKTNIDSKNDGLENVSPFKHGYFG